MKKTLIHILSFLVFFCASAYASTAPADEHGSIFIRTLRGNAAAFKTGSQVSNLSENQTVLAKDVQIRCEDGDFASFVLSNRCAGILKGPGAIIISKFITMSPPPSGYASEEEPSPSSIEIYLEKGDLTISRSLPRPSSKFLISTPFGKFECIGKDIKIVVDENSATAYAPENPFNYIGEESPKPEYVGIGYTITANKKGDSIELKRSSVDSNSKNIKSDLNAAENAWRTTLFFENEEDKSVHGKRTVSRSFWLNRSTPPRRF